MAALTYDSLIVIALWMLATAAVLPFNSGQAFDSNNYLFQLYLLLVAVGFYVGFWRFGGQTLGMRAWKIKLQSKDAESRPSWGQLIARAVIATVGGLCFGLAYLWMLWDKDKLCLQDRFSHTRVAQTTAS